MIKMNFSYLIVICIFVAYKGDLLCLQEVELNFFKRELSPLLKKYKNMNGLYLKKNSREGLACFYSSNKFVYVLKFLMLIFI